MLKRERETLSPTGHIIDIVSGVLVCVYVHMCVSKCGCESMQQIVNEKKKVGETCNEWTKQCPFKHHGTTSILIRSMGGNFIDQLSYSETDI